MHFLELRTDDIHAVLVRLLDRIRVCGLILAAVDAARSHDGYTVTVCLETDDADAVERLSGIVSKVVGATLIRIGLANPQGGRVALQATK